MSLPYVDQILEYLPGGELFERIIDCNYIILTEVDIAGFIHQILTGGSKTIRVGDWIYNLFAHNIIRNRLC